MGLAFEKFKNCKFTPTGPCKFTPLGPVPVPVILLTAACGAAQDESSPGAPTAASVTSRLPAFRSSAAK